MDECPTALGRALLEERLKKPPHTATREPPCVTTGPAEPSTGTPPTSWPPSSQTHLANGRDSGPGEDKEGATPSAPQDLPA